MACGTTTTLHWYIRWMSVGGCGGSNAVLADEMQWVKAHWGAACNNDDDATVNIMWCRGAEPEAAAGSQSSPIIVRSFVRLSVVLNKHLLRMPTRIVCTQTPLVYFPIYLRTYFISILQMLMLLQVLLAYLSCSCSRIIMSALNTHFMWHVSSVFVCGCFKLIVDLFI